jgi:hypothetical protein
MSRSSFLTKGSVVYNEQLKLTKSSKLLQEAEEAAHVEYEAEWTIRSSLQVLGGFILLFNSYAQNQDDIAKM